MGRNTGIDRTFILVFCAALAAAAALFLMWLAVWDETITQLKQADWRAVSAVLV